MVFTVRSKKKTIEAAAHHLYGAVVRHARRPEFYTVCGVPDSVDGRFDMIALHAALVLRRLRVEPGDGADAAARLAQYFFDLMFADMDQNLREMGAGDLGVGRRVKAMAQAFYGRAAAYDKGLAGDAAELTQAIRRNLYGTLAETDQPTAAVLERVAGYVRDQVAALGTIGLEELLAGDVAFGEPPSALVGTAAGQEAGP